MTPTATNSLPLLAISTGDPAGIGPEIVLKAIRLTDVQNSCRLLVIGDARIYTQRMQMLKDLKVPLVLTAQATTAVYAPGTLTLLDLKDADPAECPIGQVSAPAGKAAVEAVYAACDLALAGQADAIVTGPLNKAAMNLAGYHFAGHTELLADRTKADQVRMMLAGPKLRVIHVSTHVSLEEAIRRVTQARVEETIATAQSACLALGIAQPHIAVAGLNPHAGEGGLFGDQESREIQPAIASARARGWNVSDPQPPDTVFLRAANGDYDIVVAMYHDQGHIPMKMLAFDEGVNVTLGLPIIRTSVDHGTAFNIAGTGQASPASLAAAIRVALQMVRARE